MLTRCLSLLCILLFWNVPPALAGRWYSGIIHVHTTFSDGSDSVPQRVEKAKGLGYEFLIVTDHYEQIDSLEKPTAKSGGNLANPAAIDVTFNDYRHNCDRQTDSSFVTIPGAEIQALWKAESNTQDMSHTLALGPLGSSSSRDLDKLLASSVTQRGIIACVNDKMHMLSVAAHPTLVSTKSFSCRPWEWQRCRYDLRTPAAYEGIRGVEFFNCDTVQQNRDVLTWYLSLVKERKPVFVTSGCDSHGWKDTKDGERWQRATRVFGDSLSSKGILYALGDGRSYATANGTYIKEMNHRPGRSVQTVDRPGFRFTVSFAKPTSSAKTIVMYRDGSEVADSRRTFKKGLSDLRYEWDDASADQSEHWYVLWMDGCLATSPIRLEVTQTPEMGSGRETTLVEPVLEATRVLWPRMSLDGRSIYYFDNYSGGARFYKISLGTRRVEPVTRGLDTPDDVLWSPRLKRALLSVKYNRYTMERYGSPFAVPGTRDGTSTRWVYDFGTKKLTRLSGAFASPPGDDRQMAVWLDDGRLVYCAANSAGDASTVKVSDHRGLHGSVVAELGTLYVDRIVGIAGRRLWLLGTPGEGIRNLYALDLATRQMKMRATDVGGDALVSPSGRAALVARSGRLYWVSAGMSTTEDTGLRTAINKVAWLDDARFVAAVPGAGGDQFVMYSLTTRTVTPIRHRGPRGGLRATQLMPTPDSRVLYFTSDDHLYRVRITAVSAGQ